MGQKLLRNDWNIVSEVELVYKSKMKASERPQLKQIIDVVEFLKQNWDANRIELLEQFKVILMNRSLRVLGIYEVSSGGVSGTMVDPKLIFMAALKMNANTLILAHNHPSGNPEPSEADKKVTQKIKDAANLLDMRLVDHIILTTEGFYSFADEGLL
ncbi:DNA repair protein radc [Hydrobacter penzbergensis]|uniref:DNA repair protein radc n=2 Tax=Hydrobacter penzbergensis TaxID=1235997 RepID=A0A8X8ID96_9BACT|nr:DNA repair protein radc [Hydrobacter penzbergensis]